MGNGLDGESKVEGSVGDGLFVKRTDGRDGNDDLGDFLALHELGIQHRTDTHDGHAVESLIDLRHVVVDKSHHFILEVAFLLQGVVGNHSCCSGTIDNDIGGGAATTEELVVNLLHGQARDNHQHAENEIQRQRLAVREQVVRSDDGGIELIVHNVDQPAESQRNDCGKDDFVDICHARMTNDATERARNQEAGDAGKEDPGTDSRRPPPGNSIHRHGKRAILRKAHIE